MNWNLVLWITCVVFVYLGHQATKNSILSVGGIRKTKMHFHFPIEKIAQLLRTSGSRVNHKKIERIWREEGLQLPERHKRRRRLYHKDSSIIRMRPNGPNHVWAIDFVHDKLSNNRPYKMLTVMENTPARHSLFMWRIK